LKRLCDFIRVPRDESLHKLIAEQQKLDAIKKAADAALVYQAMDSNILQLALACEDYKRIIEKEVK
jgi:hypothetical protein